MKKQKGNKQDTPVDDWHLLEELCTIEEEIQQEQGHKELDKEAMQYAALPYT
jgi:hypothetical protein